MLERLDFKKGEKELYSASDKYCNLVEAPLFKFFTIKGQGDPNTSPEYQAGLEALYAAAYALRFLLKEEEGLVSTVAPLEGLWWADDISDFFDFRREHWKWLMMIRQPRVASLPRVEEALRRAEKKEPSAALKKVRCEDYEEGRAAQILHLGPYSAEGLTIHKLHCFIYEEGYQPRDKHHEIYLSDPRKTALEKLRTIIRQPVEWHNIE